MLLGVLDGVGGWGLGAFAQKVLVGLPQAEVEVLRSIIVRPTEGGLILILLKPNMKGVCDEIRVLRECLVSNFLKLSRELGLPRSELSLKVIK